MARRYGLTYFDRLYTIDDVLIEQIVSNLLIPMLDRYNDLDGLDWRGLLCENSDEQIHEFEILNQEMLDLMGPHEIPFLHGVNKGTYQHFVDKYGIGLGYDTTFLQHAKRNDYVDKMAKAIEQDKRRIRNEILKSILNPTFLGQGFWNQTFDVNSGLTTPPAWGTNAFVASHSHYFTSGTATLNTTNTFSIMKQHIKEHGDTGGDFVCIMNSTDLSTLENLASWVATGANISNEFTDRVSEDGLEKDFRLKGIRFICDDWVPQGYMIMFGGLSKQKPIKFHEPTNDQFKGLLWVPGKNDASLGKYPIVDSYVMRFFSCRVYHRWQGVVCQIGTGTYSPPSDHYT